MSWGGDAGVARRVALIRPGLQARLIRLMEAVENVGLEQLREPHVKHLEGKLWELRAKASEASRAASM